MVDMRKAHYAVAVGRQTGIFGSWEECNQQVHGYTGAIFKKFTSINQAEDFLRQQRRTERTLAPASAVSLLSKYVQPTKSNVAINTTDLECFSFNPLEDLLDTKSDLPEGSSKSTQCLEKKTLCHFDVLPSSSTISSVTVMFKGGSRGNQGIAGAGAVVQIKFITIDAISTRSITRLAHVRHYVGETFTNYESQYYGLIRGLEVAKDQVLEIIKGSPTNQKKQKIQLIIQSDSELVIRQLGGFYQVKEPALVVLHSKAQSLLEQFEEWQDCCPRIEHISRYSNSEADQLCKVAMDTKRSWVSTRSEGDLLNDIHLGWNFDVSSNTTQADASYDGIKCSLQPNSIGKQTVMSFVATAETSADDKENHSPPTSQTTPVVNESNFVFHWQSENATSVVLPEKHVHVPRLGEWEKHTKGIGTKLLGKMGLDKNGRIGRRHDLTTHSGPIKVQLHPAKLGLGYRKFSHLSEINQMQPLPTLQQMESPQQDELNHCTTKPVPSATPIALLSEEITGKKIRDIFWI